MLTEEQRIKAQITLLSQTEDKEKAYALIRHKKACLGMKWYGIPYRVYLDYLKRWDTKTPEEQNETVCINPMYPLNGYPRSKLKTVTLDDLREDLPEDNRLLPFESIETLKPEVQREIIRTIEPLKQWVLFDDNWRYYFLHFLNGYDYMSFTEFDFYGTNEHSDIYTSQDISLLKKIYGRYQEEYNKDTTLYMSTEPATSKTEKAQYTDLPFNVVLDKETLIERESLIEQMGIKPRLNDAEYRIVHGTEPQHGTNK